jgi:hypothetical protein
VIAGGEARLELDVLAYEFPDGGDSANWLKVELAGSLPQGSWKARDASLETWDLLHLADWFDSLASGEPADAEMEFTEPNLSFELLERDAEDLVVRVWIEGELRPRWNPPKTWGDRDLFADLRLHGRDATRVATELRMKALHFPPRVEAG